MLLIDVGNSRIKSAVWMDGHWLMPRALEYKKNNASNLLDEITAGISPQPVYIACVVDAMKEPLLEWFHKHWGQVPEFVVAVKTRCGVQNGYTNPEMLGVDRWLAMVAAFSRYKSPVCVIDCGTAVTVDVVDGQGIHRGGLIMPGLQLMRASLFCNTSKLAPGAGLQVELANNTQDAIASGCYQLLASGLDAICQVQQAKYSDMRIVMTGGDGAAVARIMQSNSVFISTLVLDGLLLVATQEC